MFQLTGGLLLSAGIIALICFVVAKLPFRDPIMRFDGWVTKKLEGRKKKKEPEWALSSMMYKKENPGYEHDKDE